MSSERERTQSRRRRLNEELRALSLGRLMRGTVTEKLRSCGKPNCKCSQDPTQRHKGKYFGVHLEGRTVTVALRREDEEQVVKAVAAYGRLWEIVNELTLCELSDLRRKARERRRLRVRRRG